MLAYTSSGSTPSRASGSRKSTYAKSPSPFLTKWPDLVRAGEAPAQFLIGSVQIDANAAVALLDVSRHLAIQLYFGHFDPQHPSHLNGIHELKIGRKFTYKGKKKSFLVAGCPTGSWVTKGNVSFDDDTELGLTHVFPCTPKG